MASRSFDIYNFLASRASPYYQLPVPSYSTTFYVPFYDYQQPFIRPPSYTLTLPNTRSYQLYAGIYPEQVNQI